MQSGSYDGGTRSLAAYFAGALGLTAQANIIKGIIANLWRL